MIFAACLSLVYCKSINLTGIGAFTIMSDSILLSCSFSDTQAVLRIDEHGWGNQNLMDKTVDRYTITSAHLTPEIRKALLATVGLHCEIYAEDSPKIVEIYCNYIIDCIELDGAEFVREADTLQIEDLQNKLKWLADLYASGESEHYSFRKRHDDFFVSLVSWLKNAEERSRRKSVFFSKPRQFLGINAHTNPFDREIAAYHFVLNQIEEFKSRRSD